MLIVFFFSFLKMTGARKCGTDNSWQLISLQEVELDHKPSGVGTPGLWIVKSL